MITIKNNNLIFDPRSLPRVTNLIIGNIIFSPRAHCAIGGKWFVHPRCRDSLVMDCHNLDIEDLYHQTIKSMCRVYWEKHGRCVIVIDTLTNKATFFDTPYIKSDKVLVTWARSYVPYCIWRRFV